MKKHLSKTIIPFLISFILLYLAFRNIEWENLWQSLSSISWLILFICCANAVFSIWMRAWRWRILLNPLKKISLTSIFSCTMIGFMANNVLPAHAGEVIKPYVLGRKENISSVSAFATVIIERLLDSFALITMLILVLGIAPIDPAYKMLSVLIGLATILLILVLILLSTPESRLRVWLINWINRLPEKIRLATHDHVMTFLHGLNVFKDRSILLPLVGKSMLIWLHMAFTIYIILKWYPYINPVENSLWLVSIVVVVFLAFGVSVPAAPGHFGTTQIAFILAMGYFGFSEVDAVGCSLVFNITQYVPITVAGIGYLFREGLTLRHLRSSVEKPDGAGA